MRHNKNFNHLGRQAGHRKAMLSNMASSLILHKRIETTVAKAKAVKQFVEPLVTKSKEDTTHSRRIVFSYLKQKEAVTELFRTIAPKIADRPGRLHPHSEDRIPVGRCRRYVHHRICRFQRGLHVWVFSDGCRGETQDPSFAR